MKSTAWVGASRFYGDKLELNNIHEAVQCELMMENSAIASMKNTAWLQVGGEDLVGGEDACQDAK